MHFNFFLITAAIVAAPGVAFGQPSGAPAEPPPAQASTSLESPFSYGARVGLHRTDQSLEDTVDSDGASFGPMVELEAGARLSPRWLLTGYLRMQDYRNDVTRGPMPDDAVTYHQTELTFGPRVSVFVVPRVFLALDLGLLQEHVSVDGSSGWNQGFAFGVHAGVRIVPLGPVWLEAMLDAGTWMIHSDGARWLAMSVGVRH